MRILDDYVGREIRHTDERLEHVERRPEMVEQLDRIVASGSMSGSWFLFEYPSSRYSG